ncbi:hypothetical protein AJ80_08759 [Polytolypa hystricis UAMH7299]|uniref:TIGR00730 family protein n=1 Tax=Polytolypa hystricis (strain UAMH7299) TaxID=1447883 RepID=A0A2B7WUL0_POLH7|nr:hypothetical protein AJ80_08759 [Polytolypa hystricis UAMH7299]
MATEQKKPTVICVFCGAHAGTNPAHLASARALAQQFHKENITLVYGGGTNGIMGELARTLVSLSGPQSVHGIIPTALVKVETGRRSTKTAASTNPAAKALAGEVLVEEESMEGGRGGKTPERVLAGYEEDIAAQESEYGLTTLVPDMHTRKQIMAKKVIEGGPGSGFVVLAGGFGTLEEAMEMTTWNQIGIHSRGIVLLNIEGYWDGLLDWVDRSVKEGFVSEVNRHILVECKEPEKVVEALREYQLSGGRFVLEWEGVKEG